MRIFILTACMLLLLSVTTVSCQPDKKEPAQVELISTDTIVEQVTSRVLTDHDVVNGAERTAEYFPLLKGKRVAVAGNHTSLIGETHLVDSLIGAGIDVVRIFSPEHGFRGEAAAGETVKSSVDAKTGVPVVSLYGSSKKPTAGHLADVDVIVFDIQDVGVRFYTYISTLHYLMEAAAEHNVKVLILDRPNPNGFYVDGPVLDPAFKSFVGMHPVPVVHGMTIAEYARMINEEGWLAGGKKADLGWVLVEDYKHTDLYHLPVKPSPNLPDMAAIYLYPSLCFFEGTDVSVGRGTGQPFSIIGHPSSDTGSYYFTPKDIKGVAMNPPQEGVKCRGFDLKNEGLKLPEAKYPFSLEWVTLMDQHTGNRNQFYNNFFDKLAGNGWLRKSLDAGDDHEVIRSRWEKEVNDFLPVRKKYLLYPDF